MTPPLDGIRVIEFEGLGPGPLAGRMLADMGAQVTVIVRPGARAVAERLGGRSESPLRRGKRVVFLDLKLPEGRADAMALVPQADALIEGNRPGVMERLGLGPADCAERNPRLVYGRMTGWGQRGPLAQAAGHDLNYVALTGLLSLSAHRGERPIVPLRPCWVTQRELSAMAFGMVCSILDPRRSPKRLRPRGGWCDRRRGGDAGRHRAMGARQRPARWRRRKPVPRLALLRCVRLRDGRFITIGALEPQFYGLLLHKLGLTDLDPAAQYDKAGWPELKKRLSALFASRPRAHWCEMLEGTDVCFAPVLGIAEAAEHPHMAARRVYATSPDGAVHPEPAPRFLPLT